MRFLEFKSLPETQDSNLEFYFQKRSNLFYMTKAHITLELQMWLNELLHMIIMHKIRIQVAFWERDHHDFVFLISHCFFIGNTKRGNSP
jgi:hypothetical protein